MDKFLITIYFLLFPLIAIHAQELRNGIVKDTAGKPLCGIKVTKITEKKNYCITDENGSFSLILKEGDYIELSYADKAFKRIRVTEDDLDLRFDIKNNAVVDMSFIKRTEENKTQSTSSIYADLLAKNATSTLRLNNALYGLIPGLHLTQQTGWDANATMNIRGRGGLDNTSPLVLVDGFERGITHLTIEEIESIQVLKDGAATALMGAQGANGVIIVNTKRGLYNEFDIDINYRHGFEFPINKIEMADAYTYAKALNEALNYDGLPLRYKDTELEQLKNGSNPNLYPNINWYDESTRKLSENNQFNIMIRGGGKKTRYAALIDYKNRFGLLNEKYTHYSDRYNSQIRNYDLSLRMNLDVDITSSTQMKFGLFGLIGEDKRPNTSINKIFQNFYDVPSAAFPTKTLNNNWGSNTLYKFNPIAEFADVGYVQKNRRMLETDLRISQDLSMLLKGLSAEVAIAYDNTATFQEIGSKSYLYEVGYIDENGVQKNKTYGTNSKLQISKSGLSEQLIRAAVEARLNYEYAFDKHLLSVSTVYRQDMKEPLENNASYYHQNVMGFVGYNYNNRYMADIVINYFGTSVLQKGDKFRLYPAISVGWNMANEDFMKNYDSINMLKLRASWGRSAIDKLNYGLSNYFWTSGNGYPFGNSITNVNGLKEQRLPIKALNLETADKFNIGMDIRLWNNLTATIEYYHDHRSNILVDNKNVSGILGINAPKANIGKVNSQGIELSLGWNGHHKEFNYYINTNWSLNDSKVIQNGEAYQPYDYLYTRGHKIGQLFGLEAIGYFKDENDIANSPEQTFSVVRPGDIKYKDQNGDRRIDSEDRVAIGHSTNVPKTVFGLNFGLEYKGFGIDMAFNGISGLTKLLNVENVHRPLRNGSANVSAWYMKDKIRWTEETRDFANVPRLSTLSNENNYQTSTQWIADGSFFKLRNVNIYYNLPKKWVNKVKLDKLQIYAKAQNVFSIDKIDYFNCEDLQLGYPDLFSLSLGLNINF